MNQIDNFRKVLGLPNPNESPAPTTAPVIPNESEPDKERVSVKKEKHTEPASRRKTITFDLRYFHQLKLLAFWCHQQGKTKQATYNALIEELVDCYCDVYPEAKEFLGRFL